MKRFSPFDSIVVLGELSSAINTSFTQLRTPSCSVPQCYQLQACHCCANKRHQQRCSLVPHGPSVCESDSVSSSLGGNPCHAGGGLGCHRWALLLQGTEGGAGVARVCKASAQAAEDESLDGVRMRRTVQKSQQRCHAVLNGSKMWRILQLQA